MLIAQAASPPGITIGELVTWFGGIATAVSVIFAAITAHRKGKRDGRLEERRMGLDEAEAAIKHMGTAIEVLEETVNRSKRDAEIVQSLHANELSALHTTLTNQDTKLTQLDKRLTDINHRHRLAVRHIMDREEWAANQWPGTRPPTLPKIPPVVQEDIERLTAESDENA